MVFDLSAKVARILDETSLTTPQEVADKTLGDIPAEAQREALALSLHCYVRELMGRRRSAHPVTPRSVTGAVPSPSAKVSAIRESWNGPLRNRYWVGGDQWRLLGECSYEDLLFLAEHRRDQARRNLANAETFANLAEQLQIHGAAQVADLPADAWDSAALDE